MKVKTNRGRQGEKRWYINDVLYNGDSELYWLVKKENCYCISQGRDFGNLCGAAADNEYCDECGIRRVCNKHSNPDKFLALVLSGKVESREPKLKRKE